MNSTENLKKKKKGRKGRGKKNVKVRKSTAMLKLRKMQARGMWRCHSLPSKLAKPRKSANTMGGDIKRLAGG